MSNVKNVGEYISAIEKLCAEWNALDTTTHPWFRGQKLSSWDLTPGLYRGNIEPLREREILRDFKLKAFPFLESQPVNDLEWMFVMQHYGMPTRLLDWTESHLYALYFAVSEYKEYDDACVWVLDPRSLNQKIIGFESIPTPDNPRLKEYCLEEGQQTVKAEFPVALRPNYGSKRIVAQKGVFTIHGSYVKGLNVQVKENKNLLIRLDKISINGDFKKSILRELHRAGITASTIFPDLDGLCKEISFRYSHDYIGEHDKTKSMWTPDNVPMIITSKTRHSGSSSKKADSSRRERGEASEPIFKD